MLVINHGSLLMIIRNPQRWKMILQERRPCSLNEVMSPVLRSTGIDPWARFELHDLYWHIMLGCLLPLRFNIQDEPVGTSSPDQRVDELLRLCRQALKLFTELINIASWAIIFKMILNPVILWTKFMQLSVLFWQLQNTLLRETYLIFWISAELENNWLGRNFTNPLTSLEHRNNSILAVKAL